MAKETVTKDILDKLDAGIDITSTDLDIRDLSVASDSVMVYGSDYAGTAYYPLIDSSGHVHTDVESMPTTTVQATDLDIRNLDMNSDTVSATNYVYDGSTWQAITGNSSGAQKTFFEWLADNGTKIGGYDTGSSSTTTIYTVPAGKIAYITSMTCGFVGGVIVSGARAKLIVGGVDSLVHYTVANESDVAQGSPPITSNPVIPIKLTAGQTVEVITSSGDLLAYGCFTGYQINA